MFPAAKGVKHRWGSCGAKGVKRRWDSGGQWALTMKNGKTLTFEFIGVQIQVLQVFQIPEGLRDAPYRERGQKNSEIQMVSGDWPPPKRPKITWELVVVQPQPL
jgi:hypothetical protein